MLQIRRDDQLLSIYVLLRYKCEAHTISVHSGYVYPENITIYSVKLSLCNKRPSDVDECMMQPPCEQICNNTVGSFVCSCGVGYTLNADGVTCDGMVTTHSKSCFCCVRLRQRIKTAKKCRAN